MSYSKRRQRLKIELLASIHSKSKKCMPEKFVVNLMNYLLVITCIKMFLFMNFQIHLHIMIYALITII